MLRKMYLVSADRFHKDKRPPSATKLKAPGKINKKKKREHPYEKWFRYREKMREADIKRKTQIQAVADILKKYCLGQHIQVCCGLLPPKKVDIPLLAPLDV